MQGFAIDSARVGGWQGLGHGRFEMLKGLGVVNVPRDVSGPYGEMLLLHAAATAVPVESPAHGRRPQASPFLHANPALDVAPPDAHTRHCPPGEWAC